MVHGVHPLLPFDILEATYLSPTQDFGISTKELISICACQLAKRPEDLANLQEVITNSRRTNLKQFEKSHGSRIVNFDFRPGTLVLVQNMRFEESLNRKTKPHYVGPMVVVHKTIGTSYIVAELNGSQSQLRVAGFRLIPYFQWTSTSVPIISNLSDNKDAMEEDPEDVQYLASLDLDQRKYCVTSPPSF